MRAFLFIALLSLPAVTFAEKVVIALEDGTKIEIDGVPKGAKLTARIIVDKPIAKQNPANDPKKLVEQFLKENANDPKKLEIISISEPVDNKFCRIYILDDPDGRVVDEWYKPVEFPGVSVTAKYRGANTFGAIILQSSTIFLDVNGKVVKMIDPADVKYSVQRR